jgi:hypothetical protein
MLNLKKDTEAVQPLALLLVVVLPIVIFIIMGTYVGYFPTALFLAGMFVYITIKERRMALLGALACFVMAVFVYMGGL